MVFEPLGIKGSSVGMVKDNFINFSNQRSLESLGIMILSNRDIGIVRWSFSCKLPRDQTPNPSVSFFLAYLTMSWTVLNLQLDSMWSHWLPLREIAYWHEPPSVSYSIRGCYRNHWLVFGSFEWVLFKTSESANLNSTCYSVPPSEIHPDTPKGIQ